MRTLIAASTIALMSTSFAQAETVDITADIWADNWFTVYANGEAVMVDPVSITTERSFNKETSTFSVELPAVIAIEAKDFKENDSGLEYIGTGRQQMGDGGLIAQFKNAVTGDVLAVTDSNTQCLVVHYAPVEVSCADESDPVAGEGACDFVETATPDTWTAASFDDSAWPNATVHSEADVSPRFGYDEVTWTDEAQLIWGENLLQDNTVLCRLTIE